MTAGGTENDVHGVVGLANAYVDARNYARAEQVLREALTASPQSAILLPNEN